MHPFMVQIDAMSDCSETNTHFAPSIRANVVSGVNAAMSASDMKFEPPPPTILFKETHKRVYQHAANIIR